MTDQNKINIKLELTKDKENNKLTVVVHFDEKSSNFTTDQDKYFWIPTSDELELINEALKLVSNENLSISSSPSIKPDVKEKIEEIIDENIEEEKDLETDTEIEEENEDKSVVVKASDETIEDTIQKHIKKDDDEDHEALKEADEHTIIDKVLSQKKKGRWKKIE